MFPNSKGGPAIMKTRLIIIMSVILVMAFPTANIGLAAPERIGGGVHVVQWGENLAAIAARYGTTVEAVAQANGITDQNYVYIGQQLVIPSAGTLRGSPVGVGAPAPSTTGSSGYMVKFGDTLTSVALRHGTTVNEVMQANGLTSSTIYIGQQLAVPGVGTATLLPAPVQTNPGPTSLYSVNAGDTLSAIAFRLGTTINDIMQVNGLHGTSIFPGQQLAIPGGFAVGFEQPAGTYYSVQQGDTLAGIALRYGTTLPSILQANNLSQSHFIFPCAEGTT